MAKPLPQPVSTASATPCAARRGFTAIELVVVVGIMMLVMSMMMPAVLKTLRKGAVSAAATDIMQCWRQARNLAIRHAMPDSDDGTAPKHFGLMITQRAGERPYAALIYDNRDAGSLTASPETAVLRADATSTSTNDSVNPPVAKCTFGRSVVMGCAPTAADAVTTTDRVLVIYAQYRTGLPIDAAAVVAGKAPRAPAVGMGLTGNRAFCIADSPVCAKMDVQTLDFTGGADKRGYALGVILYPIGIAATQEL